VPSAPLVNANHIRVNFGSKTVLTDVQLSVHRKEIVTLIGPNGAGKSTLVRVVLGLIKPSSGDIQLEPNIRIGYMPQKMQIESFLPLSVKRFLALAGDIHQKQSKLYPLLQQLKIEHLLEHPIQAISGGELQRVLLARALLREPDLLVLDEPVQGIDIMGQEGLYRLIMHIRDVLGCGVLMVSHDLHFVMAGTDSVICLNKHVCCSGHPKAVSRHPEFLSLFGYQEPVGIAFYEHRHNHRHDLKGDPCPTSDSGPNDGT
jgi:zinc transport system ATP-binding protein